MVADPANSALCKLEDKRLFMWKTRIEQNSVSPGEIPWQQNIAVSLENIWEVLFFFLKFISIFFLEAHKFDFLVFLSYQDPIHLEKH